MMADSGVVCQRAAPRVRVSVRLLLITRRDLLLARPRSSQLVLCNYSMWCSDINAIISSVLTSLIIVKPPPHTVTKDDDDIRLFVCLSPTSTLNLHSAEGAAVSRDATDRCRG